MQSVRRPSVSEGFVDLFWGLVGIEGYLDSITQLGSHSWFDTSGSTVVEMLAQISMFHQPWGFSRVLTTLPPFIIGPTGITFSTTL